MTDLSIDLKSEGPYENNLPQQPAKQVSGLCCRLLIF